MSRDNPMQECDLVMKGGIASGVVYPKAVADLSKSYRFKNIGGTSAGAIAAALTAAAEYHRQSRPGDHDGFEMLENELPDEIGKNLLKLFQPHKKHKSLFKAAIKYLDKKSHSPFWFIFKNFFKIKRSINSLAQTDYGFCSGMTMPKQPIAGLTDWLNLWLEKCAGRLTAEVALPKQPLTFSMLEQRGISLRVMSTNLSQQQAVVLPFKERHFALKEDIKRLMPKNIADYLVEYDEQLSEKEAAKNSDYVALPIGDDLPVLMAVRMSLSFPVLLTAIPLQKQDWSLWRDKNEQRKFRTCWFSDGGISSNFPIHLFDSVFPSRPTFGISLNEFHQHRQKSDKSQVNKKPGANRVYMPEKAGGGKTVAINPIIKVGHFITAIFNTAQNWQDKSQVILPGYSDRIVNVSLKQDEGGLNLTMDEEKINTLLSFGEHAVKEINSSFNFDKHRVKRLLSSYAAIENGFINMVDQFDSTESVESMKAFLKRYREAFLNGTLPTDNYRPSNVKEIDELIKRVTDLIDLAIEWQNKPISDQWGKSGMPKPTTTLRLVPSSIYRR